MKIEINNLKKSYKNRTVLNIDKLKLESGKIIAILGPNGSGKSTLLRIIAGIEKQDTGIVSYNDSSIVPENEIAYLPQNPYIFNRSAIGNVVMGMKKEIDACKRAEDALKFIGMEAFSKTKANTLSGGEVQRVALARTLVLNKQLVVLDEPASATDVTGLKQVESYIKSANKNTTSTIVFTTHNPSQVLRIADEVYFLWNGELLEKGRPEEVFKNPKNKEFMIFLEDWRL